MDVSCDALSREQGIVAYHSLSGALEYAFRTKDFQKLTTVERMVSQHIEHLLAQGELVPDSQRALEIELYKAVIHLATSHRNSFDASK